MTVGYGFGMLALGLVAIAIASAIGFTVINKLEKNKIEEAKQKELDKKIGR